MKFIKLEFDDEAEAAAFGGVLPQLTEDAWAEIIRRHKVKPPYRLTKAQVEEALAWDAARGQK